MNANNVKRLAKNEELREAFQRLDADPTTTPEAWEALAMDYFNAGYPLNAGTCFMRADSIRDAQERPVRKVRKCTVEVLEMAEV